MPFETATVLFWTLCLSFLIGLTILGWGWKTVRQGDWIVWLSLLVLVVGISLSATLLFEQGLRPRMLLRGWILPRGEAGAITVGILEDLPGLVMGGLAIVIAAILLSSRRLLAREGQVEKIYAAITISTAGTTLSWVAATPWLLLLGTAGTVLGGFLALGARWSAEEDSESSTRFLCEGLAGILLSIMGVAGLASTRAPLDWSAASGWAQLSEAPASDVFGAVLLVCGLLVQLRPFPLLGGVLARSDAPVSVKTALLQLFPAWSAFAFFFRFESPLRETGVLSVLGWVTLGGAALALLAGMLQASWKPGFGLWVSSAFAIAVAALAHGGAAAGFSVLVAGSLGAFAVSMASSALTPGGGSSSGNRNRALWAKTGGYLGAAGAVGMAGFLSAAVPVRILSIHWEKPAAAGIWAVILFGFIALGARLAGVLGRVRGSVQLTWPAVLSPFVAVLLSLAIIWTGSITGGCVPGDLDSFFGPALATMFESSRGPQLPDETVFVQVTSMYWVLFLFAVGFGLWLSKKAEWRPASKELALLVRFASCGYGTDGAGRALSGALARLGGVIVAELDRKIWSGWLLTGLGTGSDRLASWVSRADAAGTSRLDAGLAKAIGVPAKLLQLLQNGDVQWYLFFAVCSAAAMLIHFMKF